MAVAGTRGDALRFTQQSILESKGSAVNAGKINNQSVPRASDINGGRHEDSGRQPLLLIDTASAQKQQQQQQQQQQIQSGGKMSGSNGGTGGGTSDKNKRRKIMSRARKHPTVDKIITVLQDKRVDDDQADQIQDLQLPMLRKVLNVIFLALGMIFLLGVIIVIIYTSLALPPTFVMPTNATLTTASPAGASSTNG